jgi:uracil-DNA glycosylase family 4
VTREQFVERLGWTPPQGWEPGPKRKPATCTGCPLEKESTFYVPDEIHPAADTFILMQNPGADEEKLGIPACGKTGQVLNADYLPLAGLQRGSVSVGNVLKCRYGNSNDLPDGATLDAAVEHCTKAHLQIPADAFVILQGKLALKHDTQQL